MGKNNSQALDIAKELAEKIHGLNSGGRMLAWSGTSNKESQLLELRKSASEIVSAIGSKLPYEKIMERYEVLAGQIDGAGLTGLIGETDLVEYYALIDSLWAAIEKENN